MGSSWTKKIGRFYWQTKAANFIDRLTRTGPAGEIPTENPLTGGNPHQP